MPYGGEILGVIMNPESNDACASSIRMYLKMLLTILWDEEEGFSGKRPFGNSGWKHELAIPLIQAEFLDGEVDKDGYLSWCDIDQLDELILEAIDAL